MVRKMVINEMQAQKQTRRQRALIVTDEVNVSIFHVEKPNFSSYNAVVEQML